MTIFEQQNLLDQCLYQANNEYHGVEHHFLMPLSYENDRKKENINTNDVHCCTNYYEGSARN